jgi:hypothetical protein
MPNPAKPVEKKRQLGNPGRRPLPKAGLLPTIEAGYLPPFRPLEYAGQQLWDSVFRHAELWIARRTDTHLLMMTCEQLDRREEIRQLIVEKQDWHLYKQLNDLERLISSILGFTPSDRTRLGLAEVKAQSKLEELMARKEQRVATTMVDPSSD